MAQDSPKPQRLRSESAARVEIARQLQPVGGERQRKTHRALRRLDFESAHRRIWSHVRAVKRFDTKFGRTLPARLRGLGLVDVGFEAGAGFQTGGGVAAELQRRNFGVNLRPMILEAGVVSEAELERVLALYADPSFAYLAGLNVAAWGRRPA